MFHLTSRLKSFFAVGVLIATVPLAACSQEANAQADQEQLEKIIHEYIVNNPEVLLEAFDELKRRDMAAAAEKQKGLMSEMGQELRYSPNDPVLGNPDGDVVMVEFFDYRCGFCKRVFEDAQTLVKNDGNIRYVLKEFPVLGEDSTFASRAAQATWLHQQDKYKAFHTAMMTNRGALGADKVFELAAGAGVDVAALKTQMDDPKVTETMAATARQAQSLDINGTPAFLIGSSIAPGAIPLSTMEEMVAVARAKK